MYYLERATYTAFQIYNTNQTKHTILDKLIIQV